MIYNKNIAEAYKEWLGIAQGHPDAAALLTLAQCVLEVFNGNTFETELANGIRDGLAGGLVIAGSGEEEIPAEATKQEAQADQTETGKEASTSIPVNNFARAATAQGFSV